ncbi:DUF551 domain-containing protein [Chimaeribacter arupi]|uniref:DUF551 domain-containing protein n=1 Tax=Chimaeribacter arupi TaxID=2060066 RepID=UPI000C7DCD9F|nr:hypothetical protein CYR52_07450 [Chimaeribacter arupi]
MKWIKCSDAMPDPESPYRVLAYTPNKQPDLEFRLISADLFKRVCTQATHWRYVLAPNE